eukprot:TRINITY_DN100_c0_g1_i5.p1 TRINITY_DN100_c0_g1~~TRINITY_DN100_c0_g1_i5.p1  ORF type:complete len:549 (-),score=135.95 TRINITY_DN100_c0_g1_i5:588-2234(-)
MDQNMGVAYHTPYAYQSRQQYSNATGLHPYSSDQAGHYNLNNRGRSNTTDYVDQGAYSGNNRLMNGACNVPPVQEREICSSYPPEIRATPVEIRTTRPDMRSPPLAMPPPPVGYGASREKRKGGRFFRRLIRPFRNLIKRPQPSEKFVATSQALERNLSVRSRREDLIRRGLLHPDPDVDNPVSAMSPPSTAVRSNHNGTDAFDNENGGVVLTSLTSHRSKHVMDSYQQRFMQHNPLVSPPHHFNPQLHHPHPQQKQQLSVHPQSYSSYTLPSGLISGTPDDPNNPLYTQMPRSVSNIDCNSNTNQLGVLPPSGIMSDPQLTSILSAPAAPQRQVQFSSPQDPHHLRPGMSADQFRQERNSQYGYVIINPDDDSDDEELDAEIETLPTTALARKILRHDSIAKKMVYGHGDREEDVVVPTAERKAAVETSLLRRLSQRPRKEELENRGILKRNNKSWKQELEEKQTNLNRQLSRRPTVKELRDKRILISFADYAEVAEALDYDRQADKPWTRLTAEDKAKIRWELNEFKENEMMVHPESAKYTRFHKP